MPAIDIQRWFSDLLDALQACRQRQLVTLCGSRAWCDAQVESLHRVDSRMQLISSRNLGSDPIPPGKADGLLGSEARLVVIDLFTGLNADLICIAAGLVRAGGALVLLSPPTHSWPLAEDAYACWQDDTRSERAWFVEYFFDALVRDENIGITIAEGDQSAMIPALKELQAIPIVDGLTAEQAESTLAFEAWMSRGQSGILLLSAARGRGKSTCLGHLAQSLAARQIRVLVTAHSKRAAAQILDCAPQVEFIAPDRLVLSQAQADVLIIDEAAMIPLSILRQLYRLYPRVVMATTHGGYEGTGQGFRLRFMASLESAELTCLEMTHPVRWCPGDALESWIDTTLGLHPEEANADLLPPEAIEIEVVDKPGRPENRDLIRQVFHLLNSAHYRTRPSDLRMLMENPDLQLLVARTGDRILGAALLNSEGGFDRLLCEQVFLGHRRPRGHLLAQMLTAQAGSRRFASLCGLRIQRIAVPADMRRQGLGSRLLDYASKVAADGNYDYLGASFALEAEGAQFWQHNAFSLVHVSYAQGKSSGRHSIAVLKSITRPSDEMSNWLRQRLQQQLPVWLTQFLQYMEPAQVAALLRFADYRCETSEFSQADVEAFCRGNKGFELCFASLQTWVMHRIARQTGLPDALLVAKAVQNRDWDQLERYNGSEGRRQLQQRLRDLVAALDKAC